MRNLVSLVFAGIIGGLVTLGGLHFLEIGNASTTPNSYAQTVSSNLNVKPSANAVLFDFTTAAEKARPAVVHISASESDALAKSRRQNESNPLQDFFGSDFFGGNLFNMPQIKQGMGSGVIISSDGYIVTNNHVVGFADEVEVTLFDNKKYQAKIVGTYPKADLAVIKIEATNLPTLSYADSDKAKVGQWVLAIGNPFDLTSTVTAGIISAKGRDIDIIDEKGAIEAFIQTDAAVNPGNSGGALVDADGNLIGINTAIASRTGSYVGYSFAIPVNMMQTIVNDIIEHGSYQRGTLGVYIQELDNELADELGIDIVQGVVVKELIDGGAAQYAGILPNDVILKVDNKAIRSFPDLQEQIGSVKVGDTVKVLISRKGDIKEIPVRLKEG